MKILSIPGSYGLSMPQHGGQNRYSNLVKQLRKNNEVSVLVPQSLVELKDYEIAKIYAYKRLKVHGVGLSYHRDLDVAFISKLVQVVRNEEIDLIEINFPSGFLFAKLLTLLLRKETLLIYSSHNVESDYVDDVFAKDSSRSTFERFITRPYIKVYEKIVCKYLASSIIAVSEADRDRFINKYQLDGKRITVVPSGCAIENLLSIEAIRSAKERYGINSEQIIIAFHGPYAHPPNKYAIEAIVNYIAPKIEHTHKNALFLLCGADVPQFERANIKSLGFVADLREVLSMADIAIVPLTFGGGTKLKVLDYLSLGLPVVATKKAVEGINVRNHEHAVIVEGIDSEFIDAIQHLADNKQERERISVNARKLAEDEYDWDKIGSRLNAVYNELYCSRRAGVMLSN